MAPRSRPLNAQDDGRHALESHGASAAALEAEAEMAAFADDVAVARHAAAASADPQAEGRRLQRLADGVRQLRAGGTLKLGERTLMVLGGILAPLGLVVVLVGWYGAANTPNLFEQIPYAISGGLFGLGLVFVGSFCYFAHWMTELVKEHRAQSAAVVEAIGRLEEAMRVPGTPATASAPVVIDAVAHTAGTPAVNGQPLVATERGTMAHRTDCVVVAGKTDLRAVSPADGLAPCKLCEPYAVLTN